MGGFWSLLQPLFLLTVYTVAFGVILKGRWGFAGTTMDYAFILFAGLIIYNLFVEVLNKSPALIQNNPNYVKKIVFPIEVLPIVITITAFFNATISVLVLVTCHWILIGLPNITFLMFPIIFVCFFQLVIGFSWLLSSLGVFIRDLGPITFIITHSLLFLTPIFYSVDASPEFIREILLLNPLTFIVQQTRGVLLFGETPSYEAVAMYFIITVGFASFSLMVFRKLKVNFGDVL